MALITGRIYKLTSVETDKVYVGSTEMKLNYRMREHKHSYRKYTLSKFPYMTAFEVLKYTNAKIELLFEGEFKYRSEMYKLEGEHIQVENSINKRIEGRTKQEYLESRKDYFKMKKKEYAEANREHLQQKAKEYRQTHKEELRQTYLNYRQNNQDKVTQRRALYKEKNADIIKEKQGMVLTCESCGLEYTRSNKSQHYKSKKHLEIANAKTNRTRRRR